MSPTRTDAGTAPPKLGAVERFAAFDGGAVRGLALGVGGLYVATGAAVLRVDATGRAVKLSDLAGAAGIAVRPDGELLVSGAPDATTADPRVIWRIGVDGVRTMHADRSGSTTFARIEHLALAPSGTLFFTDGSSVFRETAGTVLPVPVYAHLPGALRFSADGARLYVASVPINELDPRVVSFAVRADGSFGPRTFAFGNVFPVEDLAPNEDGTLHVVNHELGVFSGGDGGIDDGVPPRSLGMRNPARIVAGQRAFGEGWLYVGSSSEPVIARVWIGTASRDAGR